MIDNFAKIAIENGGSLVPIIIPSELTGGTGLANPSVYIDGDKPILNLRHVDYSLYLSENNQKFQTKWGRDYSPFCYLHPEDDCVLRTTNYYCELNSDSLVVETYKKVDTSKLDKKPVWDFIGLEDARLVRWDGKLFMCGVRRDTKPNGEGRMELSEIVDGVEISRSRIEPPNDPQSYCEKNWMPILDKPYHFVKWGNPTEVVVVNKKEGTSKTTHLSEQAFPLPRDIRGGSQVLRMGDYYIALTHEVDLWQTEHHKKDGRYYHRFLIWDTNFNIVKASDSFNFMAAGVEFCCGMAEYRDEILISFGYQDNAAFILRLPTTFLKNFLEI
jgi:hypothetical protein